MACQYCAVLNFAELETQIQKESQPWMATLNVRDTFFMERAYLYIQGFHFWNMTKQNMCFPGRECHTPLADSCETISIHPSLHLPKGSLFSDILVGGEPPETVGKLQQPRGKHFVIWKLRFHLNFKPLFLINTAGCIFN